MKIAVFALILVAVLGTIGLQSVRIGAYRGLVHFAGDNLPGENPN